METSSIQPRVLLVEDDPLVERAMVRLLTRQELRVTVARSQADALATEERFACAVLDLDLPDGDGVQIATELLQRGVLKEVIFYSGSNDPFMLARARAIGIVLPKTTSFGELVRQVKRCSDPDAESALA